MTKKREGAKMGRPPMESGRVPSASLMVRMTERERATILAEARRRGTSGAEVLMRRWRRKKGGAK